MVASANALVVYIHPNISWMICIQQLLWSSNLIKSPYEGINLVDLVPSQYLLKHRICTFVERLTKLSQAGLSRVNGVRRSSAKTWNFKPSPKTQFYINWFEIWRGWLRYREITSPANFGSDPMSGQDDTRGQHIQVLLLFYSSTEHRIVALH